MSQFIVFVDLFHSICIDLRDYCIDFEICVEKLMEFTSESQKI
jgi:hypothetical protein